MNASESGALPTDATAGPTAPQVGDAATPFRFYDNRQKYLAFVNTCNEKAAVTRRVGQELAQVRPSPPALRIFDAGMGDATVLSRVMRSAHKQFPTVPLLAVAKEISLEDVRLGLEKMPDRFRLSLGASCLVRRRRDQTGDLLGMVLMCFRCFRDLRLQLGQQSQ